jgi:hypothetical protein
MIWRKIKRPISEVLLVALIIAGPWFNHDRVICIQSDSHVRVERVGADCCRQETTENVSESFSAAASDQDCGSCIDLPLSQDVTRVAQCVSAVQSVYSPNGLSLDSHLAVSVGIGAQTSQLQSPLYPRVGNQFSSIHLSTVIRC